MEIQQKSTRAYTGKIIFALLMLVICFLILSEGLFNITFAQRRSISDVFINNHGVTISQTLIKKNKQGKEPIIGVSPLSITSFQAPDIPASQMLILTNTGTSALEWSINEAEIKAVPGSKVSLRANVVVDGSFEAGIPNPSWEESSDNFGTPLCSFALCGLGTGSGPRTGEIWAWFGGIDVVEESSLAQELMIPSSLSATLTFYLEQSACDSPDDFLEVLIDDTQVFITDGSSPLCDNTGYTLQSVDVSAFADGSVHTLTFHAQFFATNDNISNFFVDDVELNTDDTPPPEPCDNPQDIPWLTLLSTSGSTDVNSSSSIIVTLDSTGLPPATFEALLCVESNDPVTPRVQVPVTMTVSEDLGPIININPFTATSIQGSNTTETEILTLSNIGGDSLVWSLDEAGIEGGVSACDSPEDISWLSFSPTSGSAAVGAPTEIAITFNSTGLAPDIFEALLCITNNDPETPRLEVPVMMTVDDTGPHINVDPLSITPTLNLNTTAEQTLTISNTGGGSLEWLITETGVGEQGGLCDSPEDISWLSVSPESDSTTADTPSDVTIIFDSTGLVPGIFEATLCITSNDILKPLTEVPVIMTVVGIAAQFTADITEGNTPLTVQFTDQSLGSAITSWNWNFGDGSTSTAQSPQHTYEFSGTYTVSLTITADEGIEPSTETKEAYVIANSQKPCFQVKKGLLFDKEKAEKDKLKIVLKDVSQLNEATSNLSNKKVHISITSASSDNGNVMFYEKIISGSDFEERGNGKKFVYKPEDSKIKYILEPTKNRIRLKDKNFDFSTNFPAAQDTISLDFKLEITGISYETTAEWDSKVKSNGVKVKM
jgi:PKD repeat protein